MMKLANKIGTRARSLKNQLGGNLHPKIRRMIANLYTQGQVMGGHRDPKVLERIRGMKKPFSQKQMTRKNRIEGE